MMVMMAQLTLRCVCLLAWLTTVARSFTPTPLTNHGSLLILREAKPSASEDSHDDLDRLLDEEPSLLNRRQVLGYGSSLALATSILNTQPAVAETSLLTTSSDGNFDALLDLPPLAPDCCRIFFCRHGQTENNRLRLVQGARVNAPLNSLGHEQGRRAGLALARADPPPSSLVFCSPLTRARQTAEEAIASVGKKQATKLKLQELSSLKEVDFGPLAEGQSVDSAKPAMMATYARWSVGDVDYRPEGGGESARDLIYRAAEAVTTLAEAAASDQCSNRCVAVFTHSQYLRMLLAIFMGKSLVEASKLITANGSINVLDVSLTGKMQVLGPKSRLVGGFLSQAPKDFQIEIPMSNVVRINEVRHLEGL